LLINIFESLSIIQKIIYKFTLGFHITHQFIIKSKCSMKMIEYVKLILEKVSFERELFEKELKKGLKLLSFKEIRELRKWCYERFGSIYRGILNRTFRKNQVTVNV
jgi:hypothetical protein